MPLLPKEAFKAGFLARCEEEGLASEEITVRIKAARDLCALTEIPPSPEEAEVLKQAGITGIPDLIGKGLSTAWSAAKAAPLLTIGIAGVGGAGLGLLGGNLRNAFDPQVTTHVPPEEILDVQAAEIVQSLNREAAAARRRTAMLKRKREKEEADANRWSRI